MRRSLPVFLALALLAGAVPSTAAVSWEEAVQRSEVAGIKITWDPEYESLTRLYGSERMLLQKDGMFAVADGEGRLLTGYDYWNAKGFVNGYAAVQNTEGLWGYLDETGELVIPCRFYADAAGVGDFGEDGLAIIQTVGGSRT